MKKSLILFAILSSILTQSAVADCGYTDRIDIKGSAHAIVTKISNSGNLQGSIENGGYTFTLSSPFVNACNGDSGLVTVEIQSPSGASCQLVLRDGPFQWDPTIVSANCNNMHFSSIEHISSYYYRLKIDTN